MIAPKERRPVRAMRIVTAVEYAAFGVHLKVSDIGRSRAFYEDTLGVKPARAAGTAEFRRTLPATLASNSTDGLAGSPDKWNSVTYRPTPTAELEIGDGHPAVDSDVFERPIDGPKVSAMLHVESLVPLLKARGVRPTHSRSMFIPGDPSKRFCEIPTVSSSW